MSSRKNPHKTSFLIFAVFIVFFTASPLWSQGEQRRDMDPVSFIGLDLTELIRLFGIPRSVYAVRGLEIWQDDVVFVYDQGDFYILKDRVWQVGIREALGVKIGDSRAVVLLVLGTRALYRGNSIFYSFDEGSWPLMIRFDFDNDHKVKVIFIYRTDI